MSDHEALAPDLILRIQYACYLFVSLLISMLYRGAMSGLFDKFEWLRRGCEVVDSDALRNACTSEVMVYRVSFALTVFFVLHWMTVSDLSCCVRSSVRAELQRRFFTAKTVILGLIFVATLFIPNAFFAAYAYLCLFASSIFLLLNVLFLVDFSYQWSDDWGERAESNSKWMWYLLAVAVGSTTLAIVINVVSFVVYVPHSDCNFNAFAITSVVVGALVFMMLSIIVPHGSIVPSSIVFLYTSSIMFVTLRAIPEDHCNRLSSGVAGSSSVKQMFFSSLAACFTVGYSVVSSGGSGSSLSIGQDENEEEEDADRVGHLSHYMFFYTVMVLGSMYLAMLGTNWHVSGSGEGTLESSVNIAFWVRNTTVWLAMFLYIWSLVAPYTCCKGRDFGFTVEDGDWF